MCDNCAETRGTVRDEVVRRTGATPETVEDILLALEAMAAETLELQRRQAEEVMDALQDVMGSDPSPERLERLREFLVASGMGVELDAPMVGAPGSARDVQEPRRGMYL